MLSIGMSTLQARQGDDIVAEKFMAVVPGGTVKAPFLVVHEASR